MSWLDAIGAGLQIANVAISTSNAEKLEQLRKQGATVAVIQAIIKELRDQIFNYKQAAEAILATEAKSVKIAAGAMRLLETRLNISGITPDLFQELMDKEYAVSTIRLIRTNSSRLLELLSPDEREEVNHVISFAERLPDYNFYLGTYDKGHAFKQATEILEIYEERNGCLVRFALSIYTSVGLIIIPIVFLTTFLSNNLNLRSMLIAIFAFWVVGLIMTRNWMNTHQYKMAKTTIEQIKDEFDTERFNELDGELGGKDNASQKQQVAQMIVQNFFGESQFLLK